jgi:hypothetical protein
MAFWKGNSLMKRMLLTVVTAAALLLGGFWTRSGQAHGPYGGYACGPRVSVYGGYGGYGAFYSPTVTYGAPYGVYYPDVVPYGPGYIGRYDPYRDMYYQRVYLGLGFRR